MTNEDYSYLGDQVQVVFQGDGYYRTFESSDGSWFDSCLPNAIFRNIDKFQLTNHMFVQTIVGNDQSLKDLDYCSSDG
jgi:hypothetical protein